MAEIGITASLIGITSAAISLTRTLYIFGSTASAAREQVDYIAKNVSFYSDVLDLLVEQFDSDRPIHSRKALHLAEKLHDHSYDLFDRIHDLIPDRKRSRDQFSFVQRIAWNFKKTKVDFLVGELENLKSTVQLLVQVLCAARQIHAYQTDGAKSDERKRKTKREAVDRQCMRAENVIVEWQRTHENLVALREAADGNDLPAIQDVGHAEKPAKEAHSNHANALVRLDDTALAVINTATFAAAGSESDKRALVLQKTAGWLEQLINEWTVPPSRSAEGHQNTERPSSRSALRENTGAANDLPAREDRDGPVYEEREPGGSYFDEGYRYREEEPRITSRKYNGYERERRSDIKQPEKERKSTKWPEKAANDLPFNIALKLKTKAAKARDMVEEKTREREADASSAETRDQDQRSRRSDIKQPEKERKSTKWPEKAANDLPFNIALKLKTRAAKAKDMVEEKTREREADASSAETRDRDQRSGMPQASTARALPGQTPEPLKNVTGDRGGKGAPQFESKAQGLGFNFEDPNDIFVDYGWAGRRMPETRPHAQPKPDSYYDPNSRYAKQRDSSYADNSGRQSRVSYQHSPIEVEPRSSFHRQDSGRSGQPRSGSPRESPPVSRHNSERMAKLFNEMDRELDTVRYPNAKSSLRVSENDIKYSRHARRPSTDESDRERDRVWDYFPYASHREALR